MAARSLAGNVALGFFAVAFVLIAVAFCTSSWLVSHDRFTGPKFDRLGLWTHCFRSLPDPHDPYQKVFFVGGCRWIYDPFTTNYEEIRGYLVPFFMVATQFCFTICFICMLVGAVLSLLHFFSCRPDMSTCVPIINLDALISLVGGLWGGVAVIVFACFANRRGWMPGHPNNFFGWSFALACIGVICALVATTLFFINASIQKKKQHLINSQIQFQM